MRICLILIISSIIQIANAQQYDNPQLNSAQKLILSTDYLGAKSVLNEYLKNNKSDKFAYYLRGMSSMRMQDLGAALMDLNKTISLDKKFDPAYNLLGYCYFISEDYEIAIKNYNKAIELNDTISEYFTNRGHAYTYLHNYIAAMTDLNKALELDSNNYLAYNNRGYAIYYNQNFKASKLDMENAEKDFNKCLELQPGFRLAYRNRGVVRFYLKNYELAYKDLKLATQWDAEDDVALHALGRTYQELGQHVQAIETFTKCISLKNYISIFYVDRAESYLQTAKVAEARTDLMYALNLSPESKGLVNYKLARIEAAQNNLSQTIEYLRLANKAKYFTPENIIILQNDAYLSTFKNEKAFQDLLKDIKY